MSGRGLRGRHTGGDLPSLEELAQPNGLIHGLGRAIVLLGIVAFGLAASQIASEYSLGTLRQLLVRQPRRGVLLLGKYLAVLSFVIGAVVLASVISGGVSVLMAHARGVSTAAWFSGTGLHDLGQALGDIVVAVIGFATFGMAVGILLRSSVAAVIVGFAYLLPVEGIIAAVVNGTDRWLPGELLSAIAQGGTPSISYGAAITTSLLYLTVAIAVAFALFMRRDVTV